MVDIFRRISDHLLFTIYESELRLKTAVIGSDKLPLWIPPSTVTTAALLLPKPQRADIGVSNKISTSCFISYGCYNHVQRQLFPKGVYILLVNPVFTAVC
jgi:hypothetical protein